MLPLFSRLWMKGGGSSSPPDWGLDRGLTISHRKNIMLLKATRSHGFGRKVQLNTCEYGNGFHKRLRISSPAEEPHASQ
jgi:hypothetical protein